MRSGIPRRSKLSIDESGERPFVAEAFALLGLLYVKASCAIALPSSIPFMIR
jgi:hypothetical protein